jgi:hypothetical protein
MQCIAVLSTPSIRIYTFVRQHLQMVSISSMPLETITTTQALSSVIDSWVVEMATWKSLIIELSGSGEVISEAIKGMLYHCRGKCSARFEIRASRLI